MKRHPCRKFTIRQEKQIAAEYVAGASVGDLQKKHVPVTTDTIVGILVEQGVFQRRKVRAAAAAELPDFKGGPA